ncbi:MAG: carboxypeptidase-like regulatory domain-containing protein [Bacteroidetes bacterium]|nr:carboxypeptidase-like regulatory domain-containing protein [Bacteroidota bacterium]MBP6641242.1 carboxypeptidase-like regulatory domain-containing protein [Bacteroidia bacterium]
MKSGRALFLLLLAIICIGAGTLKAQKGIVQGTILDNKGEPVIGANVVIPSLGTGASTNLYGGFVIPSIPDGKHQLRITYIGMDTVFYDAEVVSGGKVNVKLKMQESSTQLATVEIMDQKFGKIQKREIEAGVTRITSRQINMMPSLGSPDLAQYMQVLPGVVFTGDQGGQLYIRGGTPIMNMTLLDGMVVYSPFHNLGLFSIFDTDYIKSVDVYSAAFPAQYGGRVSSVMDIRTKAPELEGIRGKVNINPITTGIMLEGPIYKKSPESLGGSSFLLSARHAYLDKSSPVLYPYVKNELSDSVKGLPYGFNDLYGKLSVTDGLNTFDVFGFYDTDDVKYEFPANIGWDQWGIGTKLKLTPPQSNVIFGLNFAYSDFKSSLNSVTETFPRKSAINGFNFGFRTNYLVNATDEFVAGLTLLGFHTDYTFTNSFGLTTATVYDNTEIAADFAYKKVFRKIYHGRNDSIKDLVVFEPGIHLHYYNDHAFISPEPRLRMKFNFNRFSITAATGMYSQNLVAASSDRDVVNIFNGYLAAPENVPNAIKDHTLQTASHLLLGAEIELLPNLSTRIEGWYKDFTQLTNINRDKIFPSEPNFVYERGKAKGLDLILRYESRKIYGYATYGLSKVTRDDGIRVYAPVFDRRHNANLVFAYFTGELYKEDALMNERPKFTEKKWDFSMRWAMGSGFPFTQTQGFFEKIDFLDNGAQTNYANQNGTLGILYADSINSGRLPYYHRLDVSAKRRWQFGNKVLLEANLTLINLYNRKNVFYFDRVKFAVIHQLPIIPSLGLTLKF